MTKKLEELLAELPPKVVAEAEREAEKQRPHIEKAIALQLHKKFRL
jgi:hypothetical protein